MLLLRAQGAAPFTKQDLEIAELVAGQATMAFELADAQHAEEMATLLNERARIGRDLHAWRSNSSSPPGCRSLRRAIACAPAPLIMPMVPVAPST